MSFTLNHNSDYIFTDSLTLVRSRMPTVELWFVDAQSLFAGMSQPSAMTTKERMMDMIHDRGSHEDGRVEFS